MSTKIKPNNVKPINIKALSSKELKNYNGGGIITELIAFVAGAWSISSQEIQMSPDERAAFIREHGLRD
ncbi:MAG TPA: hypothetical protein VF181_03170 [Balneolaceae bacterium]